MSNKEFFPISLKLFNYYKNRFAKENIPKNNFESLYSNFEAVKIYIDDNVEY